MRLEVAELTPAGVGAVAVLLVQGPGALGAVGALCRGPGPRVGRAVRVELRDSIGPLDEALVVALGEERVELHLHGSRPIVQRVRSALGASAATPPVGEVCGPPGCEAARAGIEGRAWRALSAAPCEAAARVLLDQAEGALRRELQELHDPTHPDPVGGARALAALGRRLVPLFEPVRVVLAGPVNAGKSTLFNALVGSARAIVSERPGTTRDRLRSAAFLGPYAVDLYDTAGERDALPAGPEAAIEARGQALARSARRTADLVLWLDPADGRCAPDPVLPGEERVVLVSRADLLALPVPHSLAAGPDPLGARRIVEATFLTALDLPSDPWVPGRAVPFEAELCRLLESGADSGGEGLRAAIWGALEAAAGS